MKLRNKELEISNKSLREQFGITLAELGDNIENIVVLDSDLSTSTKTKYFAEKFPSRFFNIGIAEQNTVGIAIGLANSGKIPIIGGFTCFTIGRAWEFIRAAAYDNQPIKICSTHSGLSAEKDGGSHQSLEDLSLLSSIPSLQIFTPCDPYEVKQLLLHVIELEGPCYIRLMRNNLPWIWNKNEDFAPFDTKLVYESISNDVDVTIFSIGSMTCFTPKIADLLITKRIKNLGVMNFFS
jgi:transketolase